MSGTATIENTGTIHASMDVDKENFKTIAMAKVQQQEAVPAGNGDEVLKQNFKKIQINSTGWAIVAREPQPVRDVPHQVPGHMAVLQEGGRLVLDRWGGLNFLKIFYIQTQKQILV